MVISGGQTLKENSNNARKYYSKYLLPNTHVDQYVMNVKAKKKLRLASILIMFMDEDEVEVNYSHDDALVITLEISSTKVNRVLVDTGSSVDIILKKNYIL